MLNRRFEKLVVIAYSHSDGEGLFYNCLCDCGEQRICRGSELRLGRIKRCRSCKKLIHRKPGHGRKGTTEWVIWQGIKQRCLNPNNKAYKNYGGRGITICNEWMEFARFFKDMGLRPKGLQIDRIDNDKGYYKENCKWVSPKQNCSNRRKKIKYEFRTENAFE